MVLSAAAEETSGEPLICQKGVLKSWNSLVAQRVKDPALSLQTHVPSLTPVLPQGQKKRVGGGGALLGAQENKWVPLCKTKGRWKTK